MRRGIGSPRPRWPRERMGGNPREARGNRLAPLALALETYGRNPKGKHAVMEIFARLGYTLPDTPMMAVHRGDAKRLEDFLLRDPDLVERCFSCLDIYPP